MYQFAVSICAHLWFLLENSGLSFLSRGEEGEAKISLFHMVTELANGSGEDPEADFLVSNGMFISKKVRIFTQISMPFYTKTACLSE